MMAETILLNSGKSVTGNIIEETDDYIKVEVPSGLTVTYYNDEIRDIVDDAPPSNTSSLTEEKTISDIPPAEAYTTRYTDESFDSPEETMEGTYAETPENFRKQLEKKAAEIYAPLEEKIENFKNLDPTVSETIANTRQKVKDNVQKQKENLSHILGNVEKTIPSVDTVVTESQQKAQNYMEKVNADAEVALAIPVIAYILLCFPLMRIAQRLNIKNPWLAWIPILNIFLIIKMAGKSLWSFIILLIPIIGFIYWIILWMEICDLFQKPKWLGLFFIVPGINILLIIYLAVSR
ncbi:MAG: hypothetical protein KC618_01420 [Candidatus Omnitrophica bacterium]|nr:hypothetical protein [Candidatus Omnitrophota bacterium]